MRLLLLLLITASLQAHDVVLKWVDGVNPTGVTYNVYRAPGNCTGTPVYVRVAANVAGLTYTDQTVISNTTYCYTVRSLLNAQESGPSNTAIAVIPLDVVPPTNLSVVVR